MSTSSATLLFAICVYAFYCFSYQVAGLFYPTALWLEVFPSWLKSIGFAFITIPFAYLHCAVVRAVVRNADVIDARTTCIPVSPTKENNIRGRAERLDCQSRWAAASSSWLWGDMQGRRLTQCKVT